MDNIKEPTQQEIDEMNLKMINHFNEMIPRLKLQLEYEELLANIDIARFTRYEAIAKLAALVPKPDPEAKKDDTN